MAVSLWQETVWVQLYTLTPLMASTNRGMSHHAEDDNPSDGSSSKTFSFSFALPEAPLPTFHMVISKAGPDERLSVLNLRSIESVFYFHPKATLKIHTSKENGLQQDLKHPQLLPLAKKGYRIMVRHYRPEDALRAVVEMAPKGTINLARAEQFISRLNSLKKERYWYANEANLLRLCALYLEGGIYVDTDVVFINNILATDPRIDNAAGRHKDGSKFHNAVLKFTKPGNPFLAACLDSFLQHYNGTKWGNNGPKAFGRAAKEHPELVCEEDRYDYIHHRPFENSTSTKTASTGFSCTGGIDKTCWLNPLPNEAFAPVSYKDWNDVCFSENSLPYEQSKHLLENSYVVHFNNKVTGGNFGRQEYRDGSLCQHVLSSFCNLCMS